MADQARFLSFIDMIDGGGAGAYGDKFEGGGIFSTLANMIATPYGSEDEERRERSIEGLRAAGLLAMEPPKEPAVIRTGDRRPTPTKPSPQQLAAARMAELERQRGLEQDQFDPRGPNQMGIASTSGYPDMSMPAIAGYTAPFTTQMTQPSALSGGTVQPMPSSSQGSNMGAAVLTFGGGEVMPQPNMPNPAAFSANPPSAAAMTPPASAPEDRNPQLAAFNQAMSTVPQMLQGTEIAQMYRDYLLNGGVGTFAQFTGAQ